MKSSKLMLKAFTLSCLAVVSATGCREGGTTVSSEDRNIPVRKLYPESIEVPRSFVADIQAIQFVEVKSKVGGFIKEIHVDEGQEVKKGDVLFKLDAIEYYEAVREAEAALRQAEAEYQMTAYDVDRISKLVEKEILADVRLKQAQAELAVAELEVEQAKVKMQRAQLDYNYTTITAPIDGYVDRIPYKVGSLVTPASLLTTVSDVSEVFAYYRVNESEYLKYKRAQLQGEKQPEMNENDFNLVLLNFSRLFPAATTDKALLAEGAKYIRSILPGLKPSTIMMMGQLLQSLEGK